MEAAYAKIVRTWAWHSTVMQACAKPSRQCIRPVAPQIAAPDHHTYPQKLTGKAGQVVYGGKCLPCFTLGPCWQD